MGQNAPRTKTTMIGFRQKKSLTPQKLAKLPLRACTLYSAILDLDDPNVGADFSMIALSKFCFEIFFGKSSMRRSS